MYSPHHPSVARPSSNVNNQQHSHYQQHPGYNTHPGPSYAPYYAPPAQTPHYQAPPAPTPYAPAPPAFTGYGAAPPPHMQPTSTGAPSPYAYAAPYTYPSHPPQPPPMPNPYSQVQAIPSPTPRVAYQPPVFKTFQERQREREREAHEAALRAAAASTPPAPTPPTRAPFTAPHSTNVPMGQQGMPNRPQPPPSPRRSRSPSPLPTPQRMPSGSPALPQPPSPRGPAPRGVSGQQAPVLPPAVAAMMGSAGGARPTPPPRSMVSQPTGMAQQTSRPLPPPRSPSAAPHNLPAAGAMTPQPTGSSARSVNSVHSAHTAPVHNQPSPHRYSMPNSLPGTALGLNPGIAPPTGPGRSITPQPGTQPMTPQATGSRPLPSPHAMGGPRPAAVASPGGYSPSPMSSNSPSPAPPPRVPSMGNAPPMPNTMHSGPPRSPLRTTPLLPQSSGAVPAPVNAAVAALLDRSDTVSSVKSLDRAALAGRRELPRPPTGVSASKSLDRGAPFRAGGPRNPSSRSPVPNIPEQAETTAELASRMSGVSIGGVVPPRSPSTSPTTPSSALPGKHRPVSPAVNVPPPAPPSIGMSTGPSTPATPAIITPPTIAIGEGDKTPVPVISIGTPKSPKIKLDDGGNCPSSPSIVLSGPPTIAVSSSDTADEDPGPLSIAVPSISVGPTPGQARTPTRHKSQSLTGPTRIEATSAIVCAGCDNPIIGRIVSAMKQRWHPQCFRCGVCAELLEHVSSYEHEGKPYCHLDYHDRFAHRCHHCHTPIVDSRFITLDDPDLGQRFYHELHFFCSECGDPFLDPSKSSAAGTEFAHAHGDANTDGDGEGDGETNAFVIHKGHPYCERCHLRLHKPKCCACKQPIPDVAVTALGSKWHAECFVCETCTRPFANNLFFPLDGAAYCTECYETMA